MIKFPSAFVLVTAVCIAWGLAQPASASVRGGFLKSKRLRLSDNLEIPPSVWSPPSPSSSPRSTPPLVPRISASQGQLPATPSKKRVIQSIAGNDGDLLSWKDFEGAVGLGEGRFGSVWKARENDQDVILKVIKDGSGPKMLRVEFDRQLQAALAGVAPRPLGELFRIGTKAEFSFGFRMEYIPNALNLTAYLAKINDLPIDQKLGSLQNIASFAFHVLDQLPHGLNHNDLAPENILVVGQDSSFVTINRVLLIDFGVAYHEGGHPEYHILEGASMNPRDRDFLALCLVFLQAAGEHDPYREELPREEEALPVSVSKNQGKVLPGPGVLSKRIVLTIFEVREKVLQSKSFNADLKVYLERRLDQIQKEQDSAFLKNASQQWDSE